MQGQEHLKVCDDLATHNLFEFMCAYLSGIVAERAVARHVHEVRLGDVNPMVLRAAGRIGWSSPFPVLEESSFPCPSGINQDPRAQLIIKEIQCNTVAARTRRFILVQNLTELKEPSWLVSIACGGGHTVMNQKKFKTEQHSGQDTELLITLKYGALVRFVLRIPLTGCPTPWKYQSD